MRISRLAERSGGPATTLRSSEGAGLLPADRTPAGYRLYGEAAVERLAFIGAAKHLGLPLEEIGELLGVRESGACRDVKAGLRPRLAARLAEARAAEPAAFTASAHTALELDALPDRASPCDPECGFLAALFEIGGAWPVWQDIREHKGWIWIGAGVIALGLYGVVATFRSDDDVGRILAAYGGIFVAGSIAWGVVADGYRPDRFDVIGALVCLAGMAVIMCAPRGN